MYDVKDKKLSPELQALYDATKKLKKRVIEKPNDVVEANLDVSFSDIEICRVMYLDNSHRIIGRYQKEGVPNKCAVYPRDIIQKGFEFGASSMIIVHNHPGGCKNPSRSDWKLTKDLVIAGRVLDITLLDHIILTTDGHVSLRELKRVAFITLIFGGTVSDKAKLKALDSFIEEYEENMEDKTQFGAMVIAGIAKSLYKKVKEA